MRIRWSGCLLSIISLLLLIPLGPYAFLLVFGLGFNDNGSQEGYDTINRGFLYLKLALGVVALMFFGGLIWAVSGEDKQEARYKPRLKTADCEKPEESTDGPAI